MSMRGGTVVGSVKGVGRYGVGMKLSREARPHNVESAKQTLFNCVDDEDVRLFAAGAHRFILHCKSVHMICN